MFFRSRQNVVRIKLHTSDQKNYHTLLSTFFPAIRNSYVLKIPFSVGVFLDWTPLGIRNRFEQSCSTLYLIPMCFYVAAVLKVTILGHISS